jgi:hypothetical protein
MDDLLETIQEGTKDVPPWVWWVGGGVVLVIFVILSRRGGAGQYIPAPSSEGSRPPAPLTPPPMPTVNLAGVEQALTGLASFVASSTAALRADQRSIQQTLQAINQTVANQVQPGAMTPADLARTTQPTNKVEPRLVSFQGWIDSDTLAGYTSVQVNVDNQFEEGILAAKQLYRRAEDSGDREGMTAANLEANRIREAARQAGVTLDRELQSGTQLYPDPEPVESPPPTGGGTDLRMM